MKLHEVFGLGSREELLNKLKERHEDVQELLDFYNYYGNPQEMKWHEQISTDRDLMNYILTMIPPQRNKVNLLYVDNQLIPLHTHTIDLSSSADTILKLRESMLISPKAVFPVICHGDEEKFKNKVENFFNSTQVIVPTKIHYSTMKNEYSFNGNKIQAILEENKLNPFHTPYNQNFTFLKYEDFDDVSNRFALESLEGLNILTHRTDFEHYLKIGFQFERVEKLGFVTLDNSYTVLNSGIVAIGLRDQAAPDIVKLFGSMLQSNKVSKYILFHNHPSGSPFPSDADYNFTKILNKASKSIDLEMLDHLVVSTTQITSIGNENKEMGLDNVFTRLGAMSHTKLSL